MSKKTVIITLVIALAALSLLIAAGNSTYLSTNVSGTGTSDCPSLCQESCQGFTSTEESELCHSECETMCAESF
ncbi:MAG: hypothetical protein HY372_01455 [Candidatus Andersenbacteria bacterium]|nr:hypothetical protein [Candidatus Andersenbacteria bacterium]